MQFIVTKEELRKGCQLRLAWTTDEYTLDEIYFEQEKLNSQGYFTVIRDLYCTKYEEPKFKIDVFQRNDPLVQIG